MTNTLLDRDSLSRKFIISLTHSIEDGTFSETQCLPGERALSSMYGISRQCLREAMHILAAEKIVNIQHGSGTYICPGALLKLRDFLDRNSSHPLSRDEFEQFMEAREIFEINAMPLAIRRATAGHIHTLETIVHDMEKCTDYYDMYRMLDAKFHITLILATQNNVLINSYSTIRESLYSYYKEIRSFIPCDHFVQDVSHSDHAQILSCFRSRDEESARNIMRHHMWASRNILKQYLDYTYSSASVCDAQEAKV